AHSGLCIPELDPCPVLSRDRGRTGAARKMASPPYDLAFLSPPPLCADGHPARDLAVPPLHAELPRRGGSTRRTRAGGFLSNGAALGAEIRASDPSSSTLGRLCPSRSNPRKGDYDGTRK